MMKYEKPSVEVVLLESEDVITVSNTGKDPDNGEGIESISAYERYGNF